MVHSVIWFPVYKCRGYLHNFMFQFTLSWFCLVPWMSCLQKHTEIVQKTNQFMFKWICTVPWCSGLWVSYLQINIEKVKKKTNQFMFQWICMVPLCSGFWVSCLQINLKDSSSFSLVIRIRVQLLSFSFSVRKRKTYIFGEKILLKYSNASSYFYLNKML